MELIRYIVLNPVRCHAVAFAGDYEWSNYRATAGLQAAPPWLEIEWTLDQFGAGNRAAAHEAYCRFVAERRTTLGSASSARSISAAQLSAIGCRRWWRERSAAANIRGHNGCSSGRHLMLW